MLEPLIIYTHCKKPLSIKIDKKNIILSGTILNRKNIIFYPETKEVLYERIEHGLIFGNLNSYEKEIISFNGITHNLIYANFFKKSIKGLISLTKNRTKFGITLRKLIKDSIPLYPVIKAYSLYDKETQVYHIYDICEINIDTQYNKEILQKSVICINTFNDFRTTLERKLKISKIISQYRYIFKNVEKII